MIRALDWVVAHPIAAAALVAVATLGLAVQIPRLEIDVSAEGLMVARDPARQFYERTKQRFGSDTLTVVLIKADDVFAPPVLALVQRLSDALERNEGVVRVESLRTVPAVRADGNVLSTDPLLRAGPPPDGAGAGRLREHALGNRVFVGNIVARDGRATAINAYTLPRPGDPGFSRRFVAEVERLIARETIPGVAISQIGGPLIKSTLADQIYQDRRVLLVLSLPALMVSLFLAFRTLQSVVIPITTGALSVAWALGLMALMGLPLTILTVIVPPLLIAIGFTEDVHLLSVYYDLLGRGVEKAAAIRSMLRETLLPVIVTTATTVLGFGSLATTDIPLLVQFGQASALGLTANFAVTLVVLPLLLWLWPVPRRLRLTRPGGRPAGHALADLMERLGALALRRRAAILTISALVGVGALGGALLLRVDTDFHSFFPEHSVIHQRTRDLHAALAGVASFSLVVDTGRENGVNDPELLRRIVALQAHLAATGRIDQSVSVADYVRTAHRAFNGGQAAFEVVPDTADAVTQYLLLLDGTQLAKYIDFDASAANVVVRHNMMGSWELSAFLERLTAYLEQAFPANVSVRATGESILVRNAADYMAVNELTSFLYTFAAIWLVHAALFRSTRAAWLSLVPNLIPVFVNVGLMGVLGIPLNVGTAMIATIAIGITVDDTVHYMAAYRRHLQEHRDPRVAVLNTLRAQGPPIIYVSLALAGGFFALVFSSSAPIVHFGALSGTAMLVAMIFELLVTPVLMSFLRVGRSG